MDVSGSRNSILSSEHIQNSKNCSMNHSFECFFGCKGCNLVRPHHFVHFHFGPNITICSGPIFPPHFRRQAQPEAVPSEPLELDLSPSSQEPKRTRPEFFFTSTRSTRMSRTGSERINGDRINGL